MNIKKEHTFFETLEETVLRLHVYLRRLESENKNFQKVINRLMVGGESVVRNYRVA